MDAAVEFSRQAGAQRVVIVSNTKLAPAIRLYEKHGFVRVPLAPDEEYARADIRLERELTPTPQRAKAPVRPPS
jgi:ribosomal protein S18 acetylase RimI-like enzyme